MNEQLHSCLNVGRGYEEEEEYQPSVTAQSLTHYP